MPKSQRASTIKFRAEAPATRAVIVAETVSALVLGGLYGATLAFAGNFVVMVVLWIAFNGRQDYTILNELGLGILMSSAIALTFFGLLSGCTMVGTRLALARMYAGLDNAGSALKDTVRVRGQIDSSPFLPAAVSAVGIGLLAILSGIVCAALLPEAAAKDTASPEAAGLSAGLAFSVCVVVFSGVAVLVCHLLNRRWEVRTRSLLPKEAVGLRGMQVQRMSRGSEQRVNKARRRSYSLVEWAMHASGLATAVGLIGVFVSALTRQPGKYSPEIYLGAQGENFLDGVAVASGALFIGGLVTGAATGGISMWQAFTATKRALPKDRADRHRRRARSASKTLTGGSDAFLTVWLALPVLVFGGFLARDVLPAMNGRQTNHAAYPFLEFNAAVPLLLWIGGLSVLLVLRAVIEARLPGIRNRLGYDLPIETPEGPDINTR